MAHQPPAFAPKVPTASTTPNSPAPSKKGFPWVVVIVIVVILFLCCAVAGVAGWWITRQASEAAINNVVNDEGAIDQDRLDDILDNY